MLRFQPSHADVGAKAGNTELEDHLLDRFGDNKSAALGRGTRPQEITEHFFLDDVRKRLRKDRL
jgi:hypothetical protein